MTATTDFAELGSFARFQVPPSRANQAGKPTLHWLTADLIFTQAVDDFRTEVERRNRSQVHRRLRFARKLGSFRKNASISLRQVQRSILTACYTLDPVHGVGFVRQNSDEDPGVGFVRQISIGSAGNGVRSIRIRGCRQGVLRSISLKALDGLQRHGRESVFCAHLTEVDRHFDDASCIILARSRSFDRLRPAWRESLGKPELPEFSAIMIVDCANHAGDLKATPQLAWRLTLLTPRAMMLWMIRTFRDEETERLFLRERRTKIASTLRRAALRKLLLLDAAETLDDVRVPRGDRLENLAGIREGQYSIRINDQWRICFRWEHGEAHDVEIVDYH